LEENFEQRNENDSILFAPRLTSLHAKVSYVAFNFSYSSCAFSGRCSQVLSPTALIRSEIFWFFSLDHRSHTLGLRFFW
jgi:hypothetical protein